MPSIQQLLRILHDKGFIEQTCEERPFRFQPVRSFEEVSGNLVNDLLSRVFGGSREKLLVSLVGQKKLSKKERVALRRDSRGAGLMNAFGLTLVSVSLQVSVLCLVAMAVYLIARRGSPNGEAATLSGLLLIVLLSAVALSPWPRWSYGDPVAVTDADAAAENSASSGTLLSGSDVDADQESLTPLNTATDDLNWYSVESMRQF